MPKVESGPKSLNDLLEKAYESGLKQYKGDKKKASAAAWAAAEKAGWKKDAEGNWKKTKKEMSVKAKDFVIFKAGTWNGETYTEEDLDQIVAAFNREEPPHIILGHSSDYKGQTLIPSFGQILGGLKRVGKQLYACGVEFADAMAEWIDAGYITDRSIELTADNKLLAVGMLGALPAAVKQMPLLKFALKGGEFSVPAAPVKIIEFAEEDAGAPTDEVEKMAVEDTVKSMTESFANCLQKVEAALSEGVGMQTAKDRCSLALSDLSSELFSAMHQHWMFAEKMQEIEDGKMTEPAEMSEKKGTLLTLFSRIFTHSKQQEATAMDQQKEQEYQTKIADLEKQVKEFADKEASAKAETEQAARVAKVKEFCDVAVKEGRMTPAMRTKDEPIMLSLLEKDEAAYTAFSEKYSQPVVPQGEVGGLNGKDPNGGEHEPQLITKARDYVKANPKEFAGLADRKAVARAIYLAESGKIKL